MEVFRQTEFSNVISPFRNVNARRFAKMPIIMEIQGAKVRLSIDNSHSDKLHFRIQVNTPLASL